MKKIIILLTILTFVCLSACNKQEKTDNDANSYIRISSKQVTAGPLGREFKIDIESSSTWKIAGFAEWVEFSAMEGKSGDKLTIKIKENKGKQDKHSTFKIFSGSSVEKIDIASTPDYYMELKSEPNISCSSESKKVIVILNTNIEDLKYEYEGNEEGWINFVERENTLGKSFLTFEIKENNLYKERQAKLYIKTEKVQNNIQAIIINQAQKDVAFFKDIKDNTLSYDLQERDIEVVLKTNVNYTLNLPSWIRENSKSESPADLENLKTFTYSLHIDKAEDSRKEDIEVKIGNRQIIARLTINQKNPSPILVNIVDKNLRRVLISEAWVYAENLEQEQVELLKKAREGEVLKFGQAGSGSNIKIETFDGLEQFPALKSFDLLNVAITKMDLSKFTNLLKVKIRDFTQLQMINLPPNTTDFIFGLTLYNGVGSEKLEIKGENVENIDTSCESYYIPWWENLVSIDVSACPKLKTLKTRRMVKSYYGGADSPAEKFKTIYMTQEQSSSVTVDKTDNVSIVIK